MSLLYCIVLYLYTPVCAGARTLNTCIYLYELVFALFNTAAIFCQTRCDNSAVGNGICAPAHAEPSR